MPKKKETDAAPDADVETTPAPDPEAAAVEAIKALITEADEAKILQSLGTALGGVRQQSPSLILEVVLELAREAYWQKAREVITEAVPGFLQPADPKGPDGDADGAGS